MVFSVQQSFDPCLFRYKDYVFYGDTSVAQSAQLNTRYGTESLKGVLQDIHFLSLCDYLVCTFSSQVSVIVDDAWRQKEISPI